MNAATLFMILLAGGASQQAAPAASVTTADMSQCAQVQPAVASIIMTATSRLEAARQANSAAEMRAAIDHLQGILRDLQSQLAPCRGLQAAADPHAEHAAAPAVAKPATAKPSAGKPSSTTPSEDHAPHGAAPVPTGKVLDPVNGLAVDPATAPKTTYQKVTYYFSSPESLKQFLQNPAKYAKKQNR